MGAMLGVAMPAESAEAPIESSSDESEYDSDTDSEFERGPAGADADTKKSTKEGGSLMSTVSKLGASAKEQEKADDEIYRQQCNLDDEWSDLEVVEETRIVKCDLHPKRAAKFKALLDLIFSEETLLGKRINFNVNDVFNVMIAVQPYLNSEPMLIEDVPADVIVVGDLHGQLYDLDRIFDNFKKDGKPGWECRKFVFLGDYVDRGRQSLEIVMALFIIKMLHPDRIWLLRGNHEFQSVNMDDGFLMEIYRRYNFEDPAKEIYQQINATFCFLSVGAIVGNKWLCVHGGVSGANFTRRSLQGIYKPYICMGDDSIVNDMVWSDPAKGLMGMSWNATRGTSNFFGLPPLVAALNSIECMGLIRGHTILNNGHETSWNMLHAIFSATDCNFKGNRGAVAEVHADGRVTFHEMDVRPLRSAWEKIHRESKIEEEDGEEKEEAAK